MKKQIKKLYCFEQKVKKLYIIMIYDIKLNIYKI